MGPTLQLSRKRKRGEPHGIDRRATKKGFIHVKTPTGVFHIRKGSNLYGVHMTRRKRLLKVQKELGVKRHAIRLG
jgi:hypothetical protein